jgi:hypothetical protein
MAASVEQVDLLIQLPLVMLKLQSSLEKDA